MPAEYVAILEESDVAKIKCTRAWLTMAVHEMMTLKDWVVAE